MKSSPFWMLSWGSDDIIQCLAWYLPQSLELMGPWLWGITSKELSMEMRQMYSGIFSCNWVNFDLILVKIYVLK